MFSWPNSDSLTSSHRSCYLRNSRESLRGSPALQIVAISARDVLSAAIPVQGCLYGSKNFGWLCELCFDLPCQTSFELVEMGSLDQQH